MEKEKNIFFIYWKLKKTEKFQINIFFKQAVVFMGNIFYPNIKSYKLVLATSKSKQKSQIHIFKRFSD